MDPVVGQSGGDAGAHTEAKAGGFLAAAKTLTRRWGWFVLAAVGAQMAFWLVLSPVIGQRTALKAEAFIAHVETAPLADASLAGALAVDESVWTDAEQGWSSPSDQPTHAFRFDIRLEDAPQRDLGLVAGIGADNYYVWVNGHSVLDEGRLGADATFEARQLRGVLRVPASAVHAGENRVIIVATRRSPGYMNMFAHAWGDYESMRASTAWRAFMTTDYTFGVMLLFGIVSVLAWIVFPFASSRSFVGWFAILTMALALRIGERRFADPPWGPEVVIAIYFAIGIAIATAWFCLLDAWSGRGSVWLRRAAVAVTLLLLVTSTVAVIVGGVAGYEFSGAVLDNWTLIAGFAAAALFCVRLPSLGPDRSLEAAALLVGIVALLSDAAFQIFAGAFTGHLTAAMPFLVLALAAAIIVRNVRIYESMGALNAELNERLAAREAEIVAHHARLRADQRARDIAAERERIMRDMHDGLGGHLMSLLIAARRGQIDPAQVEEGMQSAIDEMRLMIESIESVGHSRDVAAAQFLERTRTRVESAGFKFRVEGSLGAALGNLSAREALQAFRIVQEAITNAIKHSQGSTIVVQIPVDNDREIRVIDNGQSRGPMGEGRGLANMRARAQTIGATFTFQGGTEGSQVALLLGRREQDTHA